MEKPPTTQYLNERRAVIRARLEGANLSRLAAESGISRTTLWRVRNGMTSASAETIDAITAALEGD